ncbi:hypothetical protein Tco_0703406 [Tanacetum coccineum]|uniref:Uncharacterized protein n=1 Tax=Tanacetum coccineum TaxID=301880 RepID=A0ABQ4XZQ8_9ASTR
MEGRGTQIVCAQGESHKDLCGRRDRDHRGDVVSGRVDSEGDQLGVSGCGCEMELEVGRGDLYQRHWRSMSGFHGSLCVHSHARITVLGCGVGERHMGHRDRCRERVTQLGHSRGNDRVTCVMRQLTCGIGIDKLTKSAHFLAIREDYKMEKLARLYIDEIVARHGVPISDWNG